MSTERPEFRPVEMARKYPAWPFAVMGAAIVALLVLVLRQQGEGRGPMKPVALANLAAKVDTKAITEALAPPAQAAADDKKAEAKAAGPNVLGQGAPAREAKVVPAAEVERERARTRGAQKAAAAYRKQLDAVQVQLASARRELSQTRGELSNLRNPRQPPPTDQEQILRTLVPVLQGSNDARQ